YTIVTIDYLLKRGGEYAVLQEATNVRPLNITMRDAVIEFVKMKTAAEQTIRATLDRRYASEDEPERTEVEEPR
ncbi:MAG TPA: hypothetical protein VD966_09725, partial [Pyrinomonadaceae bacterium]|nr:hypothetical protein [Pyrinomonadaceae bacterium]